MNIDFSLLLLILSLVTGLIWLCDSLLLKKPREAKAKAYMSARGISEAEYNEYVAAHYGDQETAAPDSSYSEPKGSKKQSLEAAVGISQEPVPVEYA